MRAWWLLSLACIATPCAAQLLPTHADQTYAMVGGQPLRLDIYLPDTGTAPYPLLLWVHGGGWQSGSRFPIPPFTHALRDAGIALASVSYRLTSQAGQWGEAAVTFPAQLHDVQAAIRFLRGESALYGLDPHRIALWGSSAGGHLVALAGSSGNAASMQGEVGTHLTESSAVRAVVDYFGPTDLLQMTPDITTPPGGASHDGPTSPESRLLGFDAPGEGIGVLRANLDNPAAPFPALAMLARDVNPVTHVDAGDPRFRIVHGDADTTVPFLQSVRLEQALLATGRPVEFERVPGAGHGGFPEATHAAARAFLIRELTVRIFEGGFE